MFDNLAPFLILIAIVLSYIAVWRKYLTLEGAIAANIIGLIILYFNGSRFFIILLVAFFIANLATRYKIEEKIKIKFVIKKKPIRSWENVLANDLPLIILGMLEATWHSNFFVLGYVAANASFLSDTVSTEIGVVSKDNPYLITNLSKTQRGRSGAISLKGTIAGILSAALLSFISYFLLPEDFMVAIYSIIIITFSATLANLTDSFLGATIQAIYYCGYCNTYSEEKIHTCGNKSKKVSGVSIINNHVVNFISNMIGAIIAVLISYFFIY